MLYIAAYLSDRGRVRDNNEDTCYAFDDQTNHDTNIMDYGIYIVADGMGGHQAGEIASRMAVEMIVSTLKESLIDSRSGIDYKKLMVEVLEKANSAIYSMAQNDTALAGMGTTITAGLRINNQLYLGHAGDSRAYLVRENHIYRLTSDHSLVANLMKAGMITEQEARVHPDRNKIFRSLGTSESIAIDTYWNIANNDSLLLKVDDILLLCTDGLHGAVEDDEIRSIVLIAEDPHQACKQLIATANKYGGADNISVVVVKSVK